VLTEYLSSTNTQYVSSFQLPYGQLQVSPCKSVWGVSGDGAFVRDANNNVWEFARSR